MCIRDRRCTTDLSLLGNRKRFLKNRPMRFAQPDEIRAHAALGVNIYSPTVNLIVGYAPDA